MSAPSIEILNCDCSEVADMVASFDVMIVDPPYSAHVHDNAVSCGPEYGVTKRDLGFVHLSESLRDFIAKAAGNVKRWSVIYSDVESLHLWKSACENRGATYIRPVPWVRWSSPQLSGDRPPTGCEMVTCYWGTAKGRKSWNGPGNLMAHRHEEADCPPLESLEQLCLRGKDKHKTEKPLDQMLDLVEFFSNPGETVFDPCAGSGTTALACAILGRDFVGCELDEDWARFAQIRVNEYLEIDVAGLSARDVERYGRYVDAKKIRDRGAAERKASYARANKRAAEKSAADLVP